MRAMRLAERAVAGCGSASAAEAWLERPGFEDVNDAWAAPFVPERTAHRAAETVLVGLREALGSDAGAELEETVFRPGILDPATAPEPGAPHAVRTRHALRSPAWRGRGTLSVEGGRPAPTWAWAVITDEGLLISPEPDDRSGEYPRDGTVPVDPESAADAGDRLAALRRDDRGRPAPGADCP
jgi:hypothetical protein